MRERQAVAIRHVMYEDLDNLEPLLRQQGFTVTYLDAGYDNLSDLVPSKPDLLVVLGGPIGVYEDRDYPFLRDEIEILEQRLQADLPTFGICLGGQLIAAALGARVFPGSSQEIGWHPVHGPKEGMENPLRQFIEPEHPVFHWHSDTFDLPEGATVLASSDAYENQVFSWGRHTMAVQFHPEVSRKGLERWMIGHTRQIKSLTDASVKSLREETALYGPQYEERSARFFEAWLLEVFSDSPIPAN